jgi:hypothetical protein
VLDTIVGDMIGSVSQGNVDWQSARTPGFKPLFHPLAQFTHDTVLTSAVAESIMRGDEMVDLLEDYTRSYPSAAYGGSFRRWAASTSREP